MDSVLVKELKKQQSMNVTEDDAALLIQKGRDDVANNYKYSNAFIEQF